MLAGLEIPLRFSDMAVGDVNPFTIDFSCWTTTADPLVTAAIVTSSTTELALIGGPGIQNNAVTFWLGGGCANSEYNIYCTVTTQFGRRATRTARLYVDCTVPG